MSIPALNWAFKQSLPDAESKLILILIANYASEYGIAWPGYKNLMSQVGTSKTTLWRRMTDLIETGKLGRMPRRDGKTATTNAYLLPGHLLATREVFETMHGKLNIAYDDYESLWKKLNNSSVSNRDLGQSKVSIGDQSKVSTRDVPPRDLYTLNSEDSLKENNHHNAHAEEVKVKGNRPLRQGTLVNESLAERIEATMEWLREKKSMNFLPQLEWEQLFAELAKNKIDLDGFKPFYEWCEVQEWVKGSVTPNVMRRCVEAYLNRDKKEKANGKQGGHAAQLRRFGGGRAG